MRKIKVEALRFRLDAEECEEHDDIDDMTCQIESEF